MGFISCKFGAARCSWSKTYISHHFDLSSSAYYHSSQCSIYQYWSHLMVSIWLAGTTISISILCSVLNLSTELWSLTCWCPSNWLASLCASLVLVPCCSNKSQLSVSIWLAGTTLCITVLSNVLNMSHLLVSIWLADTTLCITVLSNVLNMSHLLVSIWLADTTLCITVLSNVLNMSHLLVSIWLAGTTLCIKPQGPCPASAPNNHITGNNLPNNCLYKMMFIHVHKTYNTSVCECEFLKCGY